MGATLLAAGARKDEDLLKKIDRSRIPRHVAIIMDGNGRWAKRRGLPRLMGHRAGADSVREIVRTAGELGVEVLTLYAFSTENWSRPAVEVNGLMRLLIRTLRGEVADLDRNNVRLRAVGRLARLPAAVREELKSAEETLAGNTGLILNLALNYGGRQEIVDAVQALLKSGAKTVDEEGIAKHLYTAGLPDPDLLIRTSGEMRLSNFLLWQTAYTELFITPLFWPEFRRRPFYEAMIAYQERHRRFGGV